MDIKAEEEEKEKGAETNHIVTTTLIVEFSCGRITIRNNSKAVPH